MWEGGNQAFEVVYPIHDTRDRLHTQFTHTHLHQHTHTQTHTLTNSHKNTRSHIKALRDFFFGNGSGYLELIEVIRSYLIRQSREFCICFHYFTMKVKGKVGDIRYLIHYSCILVTYEPLRINTHTHSHIHTDTHRHRDRYRQLEQTENHRQT